MKRFLLFILFLTLSNCSFDNKTGIWKNANNIDTSYEDRFKDFETLYTENKSFNEIIEPKNNLRIDLNSTKSNSNWLEKNYKKSNNFENFSYKNTNELILKSKKLSRNDISDTFFFDGDNIIISDNKGLIIIYSIIDEKISFKYNFYKKKHKNIKKILNIIVENNIIYASDNIGYLYAIDYLEKKLLWAKNFNVPFRSNLRILEDKIILSDTNNVLYFVNKLDGIRLKNIPTEQNNLKSSFVNSITLENNSILYLNTYGSLYSINFNGRINWFLNLNRSLDINPTNLFYSNSQISNEGIVILSTDPNLYIFDAKNGFVRKKISISSIQEPIISNKYLYLITKDNLLVCIDVTSGEIIYSLDIVDKIANFLDTKKRLIKIKKFFIVNNKIMIFLNNSYLVKFSSNGTIIDINKLPSKLNTQPIFANNSMMYINNKNKLVIVD